jgi:hypothetical protein
LRPSSDGASADSPDQDEDAPQTQPAGDAIDAIHAIHDFVLTHREEFGDKFAPPVAEIRLRGARGVFVATTCQLEPSFVHVTGRWRRRVGLNHSEESWSDPRVYTWPSAAVAQIKWMVARAA